MKRQKTTCAVVSSFLLLLAACSSEPPKPAEKEKAKPAAPVTGRYAFYQMYTAARAWAPDLQGLRVASLPLTEIKGENGKAGAWQAIFVSERRGQTKTYTYSVVESVEASLHEGVFSSGEDTYAGPRGQTKPFQIQAFKTDSDAAYETALKKGAEYAKKHPDMPVTFLLEFTKRFPNPAWRVIWGESAGTSNFSIFVDATTGEYLETMR
jgi:hypothetical protein